MADHNPTKVHIKAALAALKTQLEAFPILGKIHTRRVMISNRAAFVNKYGVLVGKVKMIRFCDLEFLRFVDSDVEGFDDCPVMTAEINLHPFAEFYDDGDDANSADDYTDALLTLRNFFLETREFEAGEFHCETDPVEMPEFAQLGNDTFTDAVGHHSDLTLRVRFYDN